jgi:hypothetical protein
LAAWDFFDEPMSGFFVLPATSSSQNSPRKFPNKTGLSSHPCFLRGRMASLQLNVPACRNQSSNRADDWQEPTQQNPKRRQRTAKSARRKNRCANRENDGSENGQ